MLFILKTSHHEQMFFISNMSCHGKMLLISKVSQHKLMLLILLFVYKASCHWLLLLLAAGWRHMDQSPCANARTALGFETKIDRWGAPPPQNTCIRFTAIAGHSWIQCSSGSGSDSQWGQVGEEFCRLQVFGSDQPTSPQWSGTHWRMTRDRSLERPALSWARPLSSDFSDSFSAFNSAWLSMHIIDLPRGSLASRNSVAISRAATSVSYEDVQRLPFFDTESMSVGFVGGPSVTIAAMPPNAMPPTAEPSV